MSYTVTNSGSMGWMTGHVIVRIKNWLNGKAQKAQRPVTCGVLQGTHILDLVSFVRR